MIRDLRKRKQEEIVLNLTNTSRGLLSGIAALDDVTLGFSPGELNIIAARPGMGKLSHFYSKLLTPDGWVNMGDIKVEDILFAGNGKQTTVTHIFPQGIKPVYKITMSDGSFTDCGLEHLWLTRTRNDRKAKRAGTVKTLQEILDFGLVARDGRLNHSVDRVKPLEFNTQEQPLHPYLLGLYIGDGYCSTSVCFCNPELDIIQSFNELLPMPDMLTIRKLYHCVKRKQRNNKPSEFFTRLDELGLVGKKSYEKFIPKCYLHGDVNQRLSLLQGLVDTDGYIVEHRWVEYSTTSKQLADDVIFLVKSLGGKGNISSRIGCYKKDNISTKTRLNYRVFFRLPNKFLPCSSKKHLSRISGGREEVNPHYIQSVELIGDMPCQCIRVSDPSGLYVTDDFIVTHNSSLARDIALFSGHPSVGGIVLFCSLEDGIDNTESLLLCNLAKVNYHKVKRGEITEQMASRLDKASAPLSTYNILIDDNPYVTPDYIREVVTNQNETISCIIVDYLQLMSIGRRENRQVEVAEISRGLVAIAKEFNLPVIALSQLNRRAEYAESSRPRMSDLRESGSMEQDARKVILLYRQGYYTYQLTGNINDDDGDAEIIIAKNNKGPVSTIRCAYISEWMSFRNLPEEADNEPF